MVAVGTSSSANATLLSKLRDQRPHAAPEPVRGDPGFVRRSEELAGGHGDVPHPRASLIVGRRKAEEGWRR